MATKKQKTSLQDALGRDLVGKGIAELDSDLRALFKTLKGDELLEAVIARVQRYAVKASGKTVDRDFSRLDSYEADEIKEHIREKLSWCISPFISDEHREFVVRCHARGLSTSDAVWALIMEDKTMNRLAQDDAAGMDTVKKLLTHRLAYLKPGSARWPEQKYGSVWREEREQHRQVVIDIPFTSRVEQVALLAKHAERINNELDNKTHSVQDLQLLTNSLTKTMETLRKLSVVEEPMPVNLSGPQLVAVLERLTLALKAPDLEVIGGEAQELVGVLERLTLALKAPEQEADGGGVKALPAGTAGEEDETE